MYPLFRTRLWVTTLTTFLRSSVAPLTRTLSSSAGVVGRISCVGSKFNVKKWSPILRNQFSVCSSCARLISHQGTSAVVRRMARSYSKSSPPSSRSNLLLYGLVAFLWERERISNDEIIRCVQQYEERQERLYSSTFTSQTTPQSNSPANESTSTKEPSQKSTDQSKQLFINKLTSHYQSHTNDRVNSLPLVGIRSTPPRSYVVSNLMLERFQTSAVRVVSKVREMAVNMSPTKHDLYEREKLQSKENANICFSAMSDLACIGVELQTQEDKSARLKDFNGENVGGDWFEYVLTNQDCLQSSLSNHSDTPSSNVYYPLVGLRERKANIFDKFLARITTPKVIDTLRSLDLNQMFDNVLGVDARFNDALLLLVQETRQSLGAIAVRVLDRSLEVLQSAGCVKGVGVANVRGDSGDDGVDNEREEQLREGQLTAPVSFDGWEFLAKEKSCTVYRKLYEDTGLYQFKVIGRYHDITAKDFYDVQVDREARKTWDAYATNLEVIDSDPHSGTEVVQWVMRYPFPMSSREYVFTRKGWMSSDQHTIVQISRSVTHPAAPESGRSVRISKYFSEMVIKAHSHVEEPGFDFELTYFDDPKVYLPSSCVNWVTTTAMPDFLSKIHSAAVSRHHCHPDANTTQTMIM